MRQERRRLPGGRALDPSQRPHVEWREIDGVAVPVTVVPPGVAGGVHHGPTGGQDARPTGHNERRKSRKP